MDIIKTGAPVGSIIVNIEELYIPCRWDTSYKLECGFYGDGGRSQAKICSD